MSCLHNLLETIIENNKEVCLEVINDNSKLYSIANLIVIEDGVGFLLFLEVEYSKDIFNSVVINDQLCRS